MKLQKALNHAMDISKRVKKINGILSTPLHNYDAVKIKKIWLFGSAAKNKQHPNDVDILVELVPINQKAHYGLKNSRGKFLKIKRGIFAGFPERSDEYALKWIKNRKHNVNVHPTYRVDVDIDVKILLYPRNDLAPKMQLH